VINTSDPSNFNIETAFVGRQDQDDASGEHFQFDCRVPAIERYGEFCANIINRGMDQNKKHAGLDSKKKGSNQGPSAEWNDDQVELYYKLRAKKEGLGKAYLSEEARNLA
jgi:hypothetical protein